MSLVMEDVHFAYMRGTPLEQSVLAGIDLRIEDGERIGLLGCTGSGKTTLLQHLNGLLHPTQGRVLLDGVDLAGGGRAVVAARQRVGMLFQFAEHQLFEETVAADVAYGPHNLGLAGDAATARVREAMGAVGLPWEEFAERSPFSLSGGEKRRAALAGVLAMQPAVLVMDEPTVGLDALGKAQLCDCVRSLCADAGRTLILTSHDVDMVAALVDRVIVLETGRIVADGPVAEVLGGADPLPGGVAQPSLLRMARGLRAAGLAATEAPRDADALAQEVASRAMKVRKP